MLADVSAVATATPAPVWQTLQGDQPREPSSSQINSFSTSHRVCPTLPRKIAYVVPPHKPCISRKASETLKNGVFRRKCVIFVRFPHAFQFRGFL
jgi:hypothetical protein